MSTSYYNRKYRIFWEKHVYIFKEQTNRFQLPTCLWTHQLNCWHLFKTTCILRKSVDRYFHKYLRRRGFIDSCLLTFWCHVYNELNTYVKLILFQYMVVVLWLLLCNCCDTVHDVIRPWTFLPFRFGGVTDWYQSIVYNELSISNHKRYTSINTMGLKCSH